MEKALLLSGGMDSTTLLWWMRARGDDVHAISIDYNQRHGVELQWATALTGQLNIPHKTISLDLSTIGGSPLTDRALDVPSAASDEQIRSHSSSMTSLLVLPASGTYLLVLDNTAGDSTQDASITIYARHDGEPPETAMTPAP